MGFWNFSKGATHGGVRWNTVSCFTWSAMAGTICIALAPLPMTATRSPLTSRPDGQ
jgi:hypothetical protein